MNRRSRFIIVVLGLSVALFSGVVGCARKAAQSPPEAPPVSSATRAEPVTPPPNTTPPASTSESLNAVFYGFDSYTLDDAGRQALDRNARMLRDRPGLDVTIEGHCDERGTIEYNQALGERRAAAARDYLIASGIPPDRLRVISYGKERPFDEGRGEEAWARNRRAHFVGPE